MAVSYYSVPVQLVTPGNNILFTSTQIGCKKNLVLHSEDSGVITLRAAGNTCFTRYRISFGANVAVATDETEVGAIEFTISRNGEPRTSSTMIVTPANNDEYFNISRDIIIDVPRGIAIDIGVRNTGEIDANVQNASIIIDRIA